MILAGSPSANLDLRTLCRELSSVKHKFIEVGIMLGIPRSKLMEFKMSDYDPLSAALDFWLKGNVLDVAVTWGSIVRALQSDYVGESGLAEKIHAAYCKQDSTGRKGIFCCCCSHFFCSSHPALGVYPASCSFLLIFSFRWAGFLQKETSP